MIIMQELKTISFEGKRRWFLLQSAIIVRYLK